MPSTVIAKIDYDTEHARLAVTFNSGRIYQYFLVPPHVADEFQAALSKGSYFNTFIRDRYTCREITPRMAS
jgi:lysyl-tRNA synthetase class 2